jgi:UDP-3-O-[3-hydroxymyristoyl] glucosamine N-acyltransferase
VNWYDVRLDAAREGAGFLGIAEVVALADRGVTIFDPLSTLVSRRAQIGAGCVLYPMVIIECDEASACFLGTGNTLLPGTRIVAVGGGRISVGAGSVIGEGGAQVKANRPDASIEIGDRTRLVGGAEVMGVTTIGNGCQVIGAIMAQSVRLEGGQDWAHSDPDERGAVLKGHGLARALHLSRGEVVNGTGDFSQAPVERQAAYHPKGASR